MDGVDDISSLVKQFLPHISLWTQHIFGHYCSAGGTVMQFVMLFCSSCFRFFNPLHQLL